METVHAERLHFHGASKQEAEDLVRMYHYSHRVPTNVQFVGSFHLPGGLFGDRGECVAAAFFSWTQAKWASPILELTRLVRKDDMRLPLTRLISLSMKHLKKLGHDLVISYADKTQGHTGYVYQACSWEYFGAREQRMDGCVIDGTFVPGRSCNAKYGTRSPSKLRAILSGHTVEPHFDEGKHLYWKALNRKGAHRAAALGLKSTPYPKGEVHVYNIT